MADQNLILNLAARAPLIMGLIILVIPGHTALSCAGDEPEVAKITAHQVKERLGSPDTVVIDVRTYRNWWRSSKKIPTALREDPSQVNRWLEKYLKYQTLIFYCS